MKQLVIIALKMLWYVIIISTIFTVSVVSFLLWKYPSFVADSINEYFVQEEELEQIDLTGIGILGDSQSDEYRADDNRGSNYPNSTYNWIEILAKERNLNFGAWSYYEEPRRQGYEYNFARSGATAQTMIDQGQHIGLAEYVKSGEVNVVVIFIGANDYAPFLYDNAYAAIYNDEMSLAERIEKKNTIVANIETAIETLQAAGDVKIFVVTIPDWGDNTAVKIAFPLPNKRNDVSSAIRETNQSIIEMATSHGAQTIDIQEFYKNVRTSENDYKITVGNVTLDTYLSQNNPGSAFLRDGTHTGTVLNGLMANFIIDKVNNHLFKTIHPLNEAEILNLAGLN